MNDRVSVELVDGRTGKIVRVDTFFPKNETSVTMWLKGPAGPSVIRVGLEDVARPVKVA